MKKTFLKSLNIGLGFVFGAEVVSVVNEKINNSTVSIGAGAGTCILTSQVLDFVENKVSHEILKYRIKKETEFLNTMEEMEETMFEDDDSFELEPDQSQNTNEKMLQDTWKRASDLADIKDNDDTKNEEKESDESEPDQSQNTNEKNSNNDEEHNVHLTKKQKAEKAAAKKAKMNAAKPKHHTFDEDSMYH